MILLILFLYLGHTRKLGHLYNDEKVAKNIHILIIYYIINSDNITADSFGP